MAEHYPGDTNRNGTLDPSETLKEIEQRKSPGKKFSPAVAALEDFGGLRERCMGYAIAVGVHSALGTGKQGLEILKETERRLRAEVQGGTDAFMKAVQENPDKTRKADMLAPLLKLKGGIKVPDLNKACPHYATIGPIITPEKGDRKKKPAPPGQRI